jgi:DNA-binding GntR family transcriptional regulator
MLLAMPMSRPELKASSPVPLYEQAVAHIVAEIQAGHLLPGERLPALRDLADAWEIGHSTLVHATGILQDRGVLVARAGKGTFVAELQEPTSE